MIPPRFDEEFCAWFQGITEARWAELAPYTGHDPNARVGGLHWQRGTTWQPLAERHIDDLERDQGAPLPPDYRLFLQQLHATHPPRCGALFVGPGGQLAAVSRPGFYHQLTDGVAIREALDGVVEGLLFDVEENALWPASWGSRPVGAVQRTARVRELVAAAPRLIPLVGHRFLVGEPCAAGNPVLSVHQSDIIVYGGDLRAYLLAELEIDGAEPHVTETGHIPFWGPLIDG